MKKKEIEKLYKVPCYRRWGDVPKNLITRTAANKDGIIIPPGAKPDGIKNANNSA